MKKDKPTMGTKLVPSIETIHACYKVKGKWDKYTGLCWKEKEDHEGWAHPFKGVIFSYELNFDDTDPQNEYLSGDYMVEIAKTKDIIYTDSTDRFDTVMETYDEIMSELRDILEEQDEKRGKKYTRFWRCFDIRGLPKSCDEPGVVFAPVYKGDEIAESYSRYLKEKKIIETKSSKKRKKGLLRPPEFKPTLQTSFWTDINNID